MMAGEDQQRLQSDKEAESQAKAEAISPTPSNFQSTTTGHVRSLAVYQAPLSPLNVEVMHRAIHCYYDIRLLVRGMHDSLAVDRWGRWWSGGGSGLITTTKQDRMVSRWRDRVKPVCF